jgi:hypothetical protein
MPRKTSKSKNSKEEAQKEIKAEAIATITVFKPHILDLGELAIVGYVPFEENISSERIESSSTIEAIKQGTKLLEKWKTQMKNKLGEGLLVVDLAGKGFTIHLGTYLKEDEKFQQLLFYRPARLNAVGKLTMKGEKWNIEWIKKGIQVEFYIYEGETRFSDKPFNVVLDTDQGMKVVIVEKNAMANRDKAGESE